MTQEKETYIDEAKRRIAHLSYKLEQAESRIRSLEYDNAELQKWVNDTCVPRMVEMND
jgi:predicted RNase H-like nuclease (RuvC/YqgF family)